MNWRGDALARVRALIKEADPNVVEEWKWVKPTFFEGASLKDPAKRFNASLEGNVRRAIDIHEGETINATAFKALIRAAVALNTAGAKKSTKRK